MPAFTSANDDPEILVQTENFVGGIPATVRDDEMHFVLTYQYGYFRFIAGVMPTRFFQGDEEVLGMLAWFLPFKAGRTREHDVREVEFAIHSDRVTRVEVRSESVQAFRGRREWRTVLFCNRHRAHETDEFGHIR